MWFLSTVIHEVMHLNVFKGGFYLKKKVARQNMAIYISWANSLTYWMKSPVLIMMQLVESKHVNSLMYKWLRDENWKSYFHKGKKKTWLIA